MAIINSGSVLTGEILDLSQEIALLSPTDTPLTTLLMGRGQVVPAQDITVSWREKTLNTSRGTLILEGAEAGSPINSTRESKSNLCQILEKATSITGTANVLNPLGVGNMFNAEVTDRLTELKRDLEWYFIQGAKANESGATPRQMNGLLNLIASSHVIDLSVATDVGHLTEGVFLDGMQKVWTAGAQGEYYVFVNATEKRLINALAKDGTNVRINVTTGTENVLGVMVNRIETDFGTINLVLDRHVPTGKLFGVDLQLVEIAELRPAFYEDLAKTGDYKKGHVLVENTIKLLNSKAGFSIIGITN